MGAAMEMSEVDGIKKRWRVSGVMRRLVRKWLKKNRVAAAAAALAPVPAGCFPVYVGEGEWKQRFVVKAKHANHPLFESLLEDAESEYGFRNQGPLKLPCHPDFFIKALAEMEYSHQDHWSCSDCDDGDDLFPDSNAPGSSDRTRKHRRFPFRITPNNNPKGRWFTSESDDGEKRCRHASPYRLLTPPNSSLKVNPHGRAY